jgi:hypothetical protein
MRCDLFHGTDRSRLAEIEMMGLLPHGGRCIPISEYVKEAE